MAEPRAVIAGYRRSPFAPANKGRLAKVRPDDLLARVIEGLIETAGVSASELEDVIVGCAFPEGEQGLNVARMASFLAGLPEQVAAVTVNRFCGSSMQAIHIAAGAIRMGAGQAFLCAGVESMTRVPMPGFNLSPHPELYERFPEAYMSMGETAENLARRYRIPRAEQEAFAVESHRKAAAAEAEGAFAREIVPIVIDGGESVKRDGGIRPDTSLEALAALSPAFEAEGSVTAGTSAPLTDGAAAMLVTSEAFAREHGLQPMAAVRSVAVAGCAPDTMGLGPVAAAGKALARAGLRLDDIDIIELNEAFAVQVLACVRELGLPLDRLNLEGGAIALGHPLGASGARIVGKAADLLQRRGGRYALATMCIGGGQGIATVLEAVA
jgi:acetyl-CoA acyltransferase